MARLRPTRIEHVVDGVKLRAQLTAAALDALGDEAEQRRQALEVLKAALFRGRMIVKERLENGARGVETARLLSCVADEVISALYDFTTVHVHRARNPTEGERLALLAVGGYGRGALAPFSDVDLLFLRPYKQTPHAESVIEFMLYALWDLGFKVGHASRTVDECLKLAREDMTIRTALLEARLITGDEVLAADLKRRFRKEVQDGTAAEFTAAKLKERDDRHERAGAARYMVEPNVKEGKGGLRDLNTLFWIAQYLHPAEQPSELVQLKEFTGREVKAFLRAFQFLWAVRAHLHFATGRPEERLSFDLQPEIARRMGYGDSPHGETPAVERFMRRYFLIAREVGALTRTFCAKLEAQQAKRKSTGLSRFLPRRREPARVKLDHGFAQEGGRLTVQDADVFERDPVNLIRLFAEADARDLDLHPDAFSAATRALHLITPTLRRDPEAASLFIALLARGRQTYRSLTLMNDAGVLGRYIPEFGHIVAQMQFNMYHSYTVDEHTLRAVEVIADLADGGLAVDLPLSGQVFPLIEDREALFLAMLLHDTGKGGVGGQSLAGALTSRKACERLGLEPERVDFVAWLVEHHLVMSDFAQKRDIADPRTIIAFAEVVGSLERMRALLVLTVADIRAVGPGVWNGWKGQLLRDLYNAVEPRLAGGAQPAPLVVIPPDGAATPLNAFVAEMSDSYLHGFTAEEQARHHALVARAAAEGGAAATAEIKPERNVTEVVVVARDRRGLFADLAGCLAARGANVVGARVYTSLGGQALDVFYVQDAGGEAYGREARRTDVLTTALAAAARGDIAASTPERRLDHGRTAAFTVPTSVVLDNDASDQATVVEVSGRDRPGLLEALARTLSAAGLTLQSAHIDSYGERAVDAFYVLSADGAKLTAEDEIEALTLSLSGVLQQEDARSPRRLQRARASAAR